MQIREALPSDASAIEALYNSLVSNPAVDVRPERIDQIRTDPHNFLLIVEDAGRAVATAFVTVCLDPMFGFRPYAVIENVVVAEGARRQGIGRRLLRHIDEIATREACTKIMLLSSSHRTEAHAFFAGAGYNSEKKRGFVKYFPRRPSGVVVGGDSDGDG